MKFRKFLVPLALLCALAGALGSQPAMARSTAGCPSLFRIVSPTGLKAISGRQGTLVVGTACAADRVFLFDRTDSDPTYHKDNNAPLDVINGRWRFVDRPIGDKTDPKGTVYTIVALRTGLTCARVIERGPADRTSLPKGCPQFRGDPDVQKVQVLKMRA